VAAGRKSKSTRILIGVAALVVVGSSGVVVPGFFHSQRELRRTALATDLRFLNAASKHYRDEHGGAIPGVDDDGSIDEQRLVRELTLPMDERGRVMSNGRFGPYLKVGIPPNPWNGSGEVKIVTTGVVPPPDGTTGWMFHVPTGQFSSNARDDA
jgi:type II secretory pathway pseudopilin PulG